VVGGICVGSLEEKYIVHASHFLLLEDTPRVAAGLFLYFVFEINMHSKKEESEDKLNQKS
jgi:hypothetical protein